MKKAFVTAAGQHRPWERPNRQERGLGFVAFRCLRLLRGRVAGRRWSRNNSSCDSEKWVCFLLRRCFDAQKMLEEKCWKRFVGKMHGNASARALLYFHKHFFFTSIFFPAFFVVLKRFRKMLDKNAGNKMLEHHLRRSSFEGGKHAKFA